MTGIGKARDEQIAVKWIRRNTGTPGDLVQANGEYRRWDCSWI